MSSAASWARATCSRGRCRQSRSRLCSEWSSPPRRPSRPRWPEVSGQAATRTRAATPNRCMARAPRRGPGASSRKAYCQPGAPPAPAPAGSHHREREADRGLHGERRADEALVGRSRSARSEKTPLSAMTAAPHTPRKTSSRRYGAAKASGDSRQHRPLMTSAPSPPAPGRTGRRPTRRGGSRPPRPDPIATNVTRLHRRVCRPRVGRPRGRPASTSTGRTAPTCGRSSRGWPDAARAGGRRRRRSARAAGASGASRRAGSDEREGDDRRPAP